jgi:AhpC/TSA family
MVMDDRARRSGAPAGRGSRLFQQGGSIMTVRIGKTAPEFETKGYFQGEIKSVSLADYRGKWVMLYFYPGDFTFV